MDRRRAGGAPALWRRVRWDNVGRLAVLLAAGLLVAGEARSCASEGQEAPARPRIRSTLPSAVEPSGPATGPKPLRRARRPRAHRKRPRAERRQLRRRQPTEATPAPPPDTPPAPPRPEPAPRPASSSPEFTPD